MKTLGSPRIGQVPGWLPGAVIILCALLATGFTALTPVGAAPDEGAHLRYVEVVATERRLPVLNLAARRASHADADYEAHQPPLYYLASAPFYLLGASVGGPAVAAQACRAVSICAGLAGTWLIWLLARQLVPARPWLALGAMGFAALLPMRLAIMGSASNDALAEATATLALLLMVRAAGARPPEGRQCAWNWRTALFLGTALGIAVLAKQANVMLFPPALLTVYLASKHAHPAVGGDRIAAQPPQRCQGPPPSASNDWSASFLRLGAVTVLPVLVLTGWWFARNQLLYGDPLGLRAFNWYFEDTVLWADFRARGWDFPRYLSEKVAPTTLATFWGAFGHLERPELFMGGYGRGIPPRSWLYPWLGAALAMAPAGGLLGWWRWRRAGCPDPPWALALAAPALHAVFVAAAYLNFNATYFQAQARYLFPALGFLSLALCAGWLELARRREAGAVLAILGLLLLLSLYALLGVVGPAFGTVPWAAGARNP